MGRLSKRGTERTRRALRGASLLEAIVAAVLFLTVFAAIMELLPRFAVRDDDARLAAEAEYRVGRTFEKYGTGLWPCGEYAENCEWGDITVRIASYRDFADVQTVTVTARVAGSRKRVAFTQLIQCRE